MPGPGDYTPQEIDPDREADERPEPLEFFDMAEFNAVFGPLPSQADA